MNKNEILRAYLEDKSPADFFGICAPDSIILEVREGKFVTFNYVDCLSSTNNIASHIVYQAAEENCAGEFPIVEIVVHKVLKRQRLNYKFVYGFSGSRVW